MSTIKTIGGPLNYVRFKCNTCRRKHDVVIPCDDSTRLLRELQSWDYKHPTPKCDKPAPVFLRRQIPRDLDDRVFDASGQAPWWHTQSGHGFKENTDFKTTYVASAALTVTSWATLASDSSLLAGASSAAVDNGASGVPLEMWVTARIKNGTTPTTAKEIDIYAWVALDDTPTYPDAISGSDAAISITNTDAINNALKICASFASTTTTGSTYPTGWHTMGPIDLRGLWGVIPRIWGLWIVHNSVAAFASGSVAHYKGLYVAS